MNRFTFLDQMEENTGYNMCFPYHIDFDKYLGNVYHNSKYPDSFHTHTFEDVLEVAYEEPRAFYLTDEDKLYYSQQEIEFIEKVKECECHKLDNGYVKIKLDFTDETLDRLEEYKMKKGLTFEEAVIEILETYIEKDGMLSDEEE